MGNKITALLADEYRRDIFNGVLQKIFSDYSIAPLGGCFGHSVNRHRSSLWGECEFAEIWHPIASRCACCEVEHQQSIFRPADNRQNRRAWRRPSTVIFPLVS